MESISGPLKYQQLKPRHIRLFGFDQGQGDEPITGTLKEQDLDALDYEKHPFSALSYIWGDATDETSTILIKDAATGQTGRITITTSLWDVLRKCRNPRVKAWIWVDQICIDQHNDTEKGDQILLLRLIYKRAKWVVAVVGNPDEEEAFVIDLLRGDEWSRIVPFSKALNAALERIGREPTSKNRAEAFRAMNKLLSQRYWKRTWIWQEVTSNPDDALIHYGTKQVRLHNIMYYIISYKQYTTAGVEKDVDWDRTPIYGMTHFLDFWGIRRIGGESPLLALMSEVRIAEVTDPRDKVFAVLSFSNDALQDFRPTYNRSTHEIYTKFVLWHIVKYQSLDVIAFSKGDWGLFPIDHEKGRKTTTVGEAASDDQLETGDEFEDYYLASWVPDWRAKSPTFGSPRWKADLSIWPLPKSEHIYAPTLPHLFKASGTESPGLRFAFPESQAFIAGLTVHAVKVATIEKVQHDKFSVNVNLEAEENWYRQFQAAKMSNWDHSGDRLFKQTIYADVAFRSVKNITRYTRASSPDSELVWPNVTQVQDPLLQVGSLKHVTLNRAPFHTKVSSDTTTGLYGLGPHWSQKGDEIWVLKGASVPFILRPGAWKVESSSINANLITSAVDKDFYKPGDKTWNFVGECFVLGLMDGEVLELMHLSEGDPRRTQVPELERDFHPITLF